VVCEVFSRSSLPILEDAMQARELLHRLVHDDSGASAVEYGLLVAVLAAAIITILTGFTGSLGSLFTSATNTMGAAGTGTGP
jgi:pilus assembly protein Flp/PilA